MNSPLREELTTVFQMLSWQPDLPRIDSSFPLICKFMLEIYGCKSVSESLDELRLRLFKHSSKTSMRKLPPSTSSLYLHVLRSCYQAGWIWSNTINQEPSPPVSSFGWIEIEGKLTIKWIEDQNIDQPTSMLLNLAVKTCSCQYQERIDENNKKCDNFSCSKSGVKCLDQCKCSRMCTNT